MVARSVKSQSLDGVFSALAHPTRRAILHRLARGEASVGEVAAPFDISLPAMSKHIRVLEDAGLIRRQLDGRIHRLQLVAEPMRGAAGWINEYAEFWSQQLEALGRFLEEDRKQPAGKTRQTIRRIHGA
jgi:DNA-binding transcriptional ArsR family regulator